jgi:hypothetical protein
VSTLARESQKASLGPAGIFPTLFAIDVPPEQFVEMRVVFPREFLSSTGGARVEPGDGLQKIMDQEAAEAQSEAREARQTRLHALFVFFVGAVTVMMALVSLRDVGVWFGGGDGGFSGGGGGGGGGGAW